ncbi:unnamed protein product [Ectocarpus sp. 12 AP-2014]
MIQTVHIAMSYFALLWRDKFSGVPAVGTRPSGREERDGEIGLQRKWAALLVNDKAAIPVPSASKDPGNSKCDQNSSVKREARSIIGKRAAGLRSGCFPCRRTLLATMAAINAGCVEGNVLVDLPSGLKCVWYNLTHPAQFAILSLVSEAQDHFESGAMNAACPTTNNPRFACVMPDTDVLVAVDSDSSCFVS